MRKNGLMYLRRNYRVKDGKRHAYWALVESFRTPRGPRQRVVAYLGAAEEAERAGVLRAADAKGALRQGELFGETIAQWVEVDAAAVRVERPRAFGAPWLGLELMKQLELPAFLAQALKNGREDIPWALMAQVLVLCRFSAPSSELHIAEHLYEQTALAQLLGVPEDKVNDDRLYRALDQLLPHKAALETHLKKRLGQLFDLQYDLLLYDVTSTYFEGEAAANPLAQRGYSRDGRPECKQVCLGLVVTREGMPLGYELFAGNRHDSTTVEEIVNTMEARYGRADRIWVLDRGMVSEEHLDFLRDGQRRYVVGTPKAMLRKYEQELAAKNWEQVHEGLEVKRCPAPSGSEVFILCRSAQRREKEKAMHERFIRRMEDGLEQIAKACKKRKLEPVAVAERIGRLRQQNSRGAGLFKTSIRTGEDGRAELHWEKTEAWKDWATLSEGCYMLRSNVTDWTPQELWRTYIQLTEAEEAFHIHKSDLSLRPIWHQQAHRVRAHILVCFLAYVLWKTLALRCRQAGLGDEPRKVIHEFGQTQLIDVILPTRQGHEIRRTCVTQPSKHLAILLQKLDINLPKNLQTRQM